MLVLTRKPNQSIRIGNGITINVVRVRGNTVQLGIQAPKEVQILRSELVDKQQSAQSQCITHPGDSLLQESQAEGDVRRDDDRLMDLELSLYAPEEQMTEAPGQYSVDDFDLGEFDSPLQQFMFAP